VVLVVQLFGVGFCCLFRDGFVTGSSCGLGSMIKKCLCYSLCLKIINNKKEMCVKEAIGMEHCQRPRPLGREVRPCSNLGNG